MNFYSQLKNAILEKRTSDHGATITGVVWLRTDTNTAKYSDGTIVRSLVDLSLTQTLLNKTLTGAIVSDYLEFTEVATPATPAATKRRFYTKSDGLFYHVGSDGVETPVGSGSGGTPVVDPFTGDGVETDFTLSEDPGSADNTFVHIDGVYQNKDGYTVTGTTLSFNEAPPNGAAIEVVTGGASALMTPSAGSVGTAAIQNDAVTWEKVADGALVQVVHYKTGAYSTHSGVVPFDDSIPQIGEGAEWATLSITPKATTHKLKITVQLWLQGGATNHCLALFQDATANALTALCWAPTNTSYHQAITMVHYMDAGTTSATTFKVRMGNGGGSAITVNGQSGRLYGGVGSSSITIEEIKA